MGLFSGEGEGEANEEREMENGSGDGIAVGPTGVGLDRGSAAYCAINTREWHAARGIPAMAVGHDGSWVLVLDRPRGTGAS
jgi:hypothetical protein